MERKNDYTNDDDFGEWIKIPPMQRLCYKHTFDDNTKPYQIAEYMLGQIKDAYKKQRESNKTHTIQTIMVEDDWNNFNKWFKTYIYMQCVESRKSKTGTKQARDKVLYAGLHNIYKIFYEQDASSQKDLVDQQTIMDMIILVFEYRKPLPVSGTHNVGSTGNKIIETLAIHISDIEQEFEGFLEKYRKTYKQDLNLHLKEKIWKDIEEQSSHITDTLQSIKEIISDEEFSETYGNDIQQKLLSILDT